LLAYLIKSEWANSQLEYTILLTPDNNHFHELAVLERAGLIQKHSTSSSIYPVYVANDVLIRKEYSAELAQRFGSFYSVLDELSKRVLGVVYRSNMYSKNRGVSAKSASFVLWADNQDSKDDIRKFDAFYRKVRRIFNQLEKSGFVKKSANGSRIAYMLDEHKIPNLLDS
jgi:hypothetical protein